MRYRAALSEVSMRHSSILRPLAVLAALAFAGCAGATHEAATPHRDIAAYAGPIASTDVALGTTEYAEHCNDCHPGGERGYGPKLVGEALEPAEVRQHVREGKGRMPAFSTAELSDVDLEAILAFLVTKGAVVAPASQDATPTTTPSP
jgi:mono/diheme cytochrome c family protein